jgi:hypothetical protein
MSNKVHGARGPRDFDGQYLLTSARGESDHWGHVVAPLTGASIYAVIWEGGTAIRIMGWAGRKTRIWTRSVSFDEAKYPHLNGNTFLDGVVTLVDSGELRLLLIAD